MNTRGEQSQIPAPYGAKVVQALGDLGIPLRLFGGAAFWIRCPTWRESIYRHRPYPSSDLDFAGRFHDKARIEAALSEMGFNLNARMHYLPGVRYSLLTCDTPWITSVRCDIYYDQLEFCHTIDLRSRLTVDATTIPLTELLLSKLQNVNMTAADVFDVCMLLNEHLVVHGSDKGIDAQRVSLLCSADWGLYTTVNENLSVLQTRSGSLAPFQSLNRDKIQARLAELQTATSNGRRTPIWHLRKLIGKRIAWYNTVDDVPLLAN